MQDEEWQARMRSLEQWIAKLLIKNEQLRMSLASAVAPKQEEACARRDGMESPISAHTTQVDEP